MICETERPAPRFAKGEKLRINFFGRGPTDVEIVARYWTWPPCQPEEGEWRYALAEGDRLLENGTYPEYALAGAERLDA